MNGVKANAGPRMENTRLREPSVLKLPHSRPVQVMFLTATNENLSPQPRHPEAEYAEATEIARYCVVVEVALYHRFEPFSSLRDRIMHAQPELLLDFSQLHPQPLTDRVTLHRKTPVPIFPANVRETQEIECLRLSFSSLFPVLFSEPPELNPARFIWMKLQPKLSQPLP